MEHPNGFEKGDFPFYMSSLSRKCQSTTIYAGTNLHQAMISFDIPKDEVYCIYTYSWNYM
eukprot:13013257-Ditylum_brightwellii.AAC.1